MMRGWVDRWRERARQLKQETYALYLAYRSPLVPWYAKAFIALVVAYAFSPIDLIPDFIPVLGYLDDLVLIPAGVALAVRMIPPDVMEESRRTAREHLREDHPNSWVGAVVIVLLWVLALTLVGLLVYRAVG